MLDEHDDKGKCMQPWQRYVLNGKNQQTLLIDAEKSKGTDQRSMRSANRLVVLNYIRERQTLPRSELARVTGLSRTTIGTIVDELLEAGIIRQEAYQDGEDRRTNILSFNKTASFVVGGTLGRDHLTLLLADLAGTPLQYLTLPFATDDGPEKGLPLLGERIKTFVSQYGVWSKLVGIGLGIVGPLDPSLQKTTMPSPFAGWAGVNIQHFLAQSLGVLVALDNDGNMGAFGESRYGVGRNEQNMIYVKVGSGIAGGLILNKHLYRGDRGMAGEIGHIPIDFNGTLCHCGQYGCLETVAGKSGILMEARRLNPAITTITHAIAAAREGDPACMHALERAGKYLGFALASLVNSLNPSVIVLDGSTMQAGEIILRPLRLMLEAHCLPVSFASTRLMLAEPSGTAMALGGVATVLEAIFG
jgi:predicted NBD/HSP70 family sugar kinase